MSKPMKLCQGAGNIKIVVNRFQHAFGNLRAGLDITDCVIPTIKRLFGFVERFDSPVDRLAIVRTKHSKTERFATPSAAAELVAMQQFVDRDEIAEALR